MSLWTDAPITYLDTETSGLPMGSFVVTACIGDLGADPNEDGVPLQFLLAPPDGMEIPEGATKVHGVTTEHARTFGAPYEEGLAQIAEALNRAARNGRAWVAYNAAYDISLLACECSRVGIDLMRPELVIDPLVIDKAVDPKRTVEATSIKGNLYRKKAPRNLVDVSTRYGEPLDEKAAHDAVADAVAAGAVARVMQRRVAAAPADASPLVRWLAGLDAAGLMQWQAEQHREQQEERRADQRAGGHGDTAEFGWPLYESAAALMARQRENAHVG